jgi:hypothetical protein
MVYFMSGVRLMESAKAGSDPFQWFDYLFKAQIITMLFLVVLVIFYVVDVFKNKSLPDSKRGLWAVVILMGGPVGMPIYWYHYFWKTPGSWS